AAVSSLRASTISPPSCARLIAPAAADFTWDAQALMRAPAVAATEWQRCNCSRARSCIRMTRSCRPAHVFRGMALGLLRDMASGAAPAVERAAATAESVSVGKYEILEEMGASPVGTTHRVR